MRIIACLVLSFIFSINSSYANRYLDEGKVLYETPEESDVMKIHTALGFSTVLEFPQKPTLVTAGDTSLLQIEVPKNSKNVIIKPLNDKGETNLFVFTPDQRFNYKVVIDDETRADYVIDVKEVQRQIERKKNPKQITIADLIKMAKGYPALQQFGSIDEKNFVQKKFYDTCEHPRVYVTLIDAFTYANPHYLIFHITIKNRYYKPIQIKEKNIAVLANDKTFTPDYVLLDKSELGVAEKTDGWLILKDSFISMDNEFRFGIGVNDETYICR